MNNVTMLAALLHFTRKQDAAVIAGFGTRLHVTKVSLLVRCQESMQNMNTAKHARHNRSLWLSLRSLCMHNVEIHPADAQQCLPATHQLAERNTLQHCISANMHQAQQGNVLTNT